MHRSGQFTEKGTYATFPGILGIPDSWCHFHTCAVMPGSVMCILPYLYDFSLMLPVHYQIRANTDHALL